MDLGVGKAIEKNTYLDGTTRDSKSEIILSLLFDLLGIKYTHNYPLYAQGHSYMVDFYFPDSQDFHEHMGMLDDEQYAQNQKRKLEDYAAEGIQEKKNLLSFLLVLRDTGDTVAPPVSCFQKEKE